MNRQKITKEILLNNGFKEDIRLKNVYKDLYRIENMFIGELWTKDESPIKIDMSYKATNNNTDWNMHIDNDRCETIGSADIDYVDQFNKMMEIFESKFRLS